MPDRYAISTYRVRYQTKEVGLLDLHLRTLRDKLQFFDKDDVAKKLGINSALWPLFGVVWASGEILAHMMYEYEVEGKKILELGCGIAMASLVLNYRTANITATDYHPEAEEFLKKNVKLNGGRDIPFFLLDWKDRPKKFGNFDLIIGSDILYDDNHATQLSEFIEQNASENCEVVLVDPDRGFQNGFTKKMKAHLFTHTKERPKNTEYLNAPYKGHVHTYNR